MNLLHVLILQVSLAAILALELVFLHVSGVDLGKGIGPVLLLIPTVPFALTASWWICRLIGSFPTFIFAPRCPHCDRQPPAWGCAKSVVPFRGRLPASVELNCYLCHGEVRLWLHDAPAKIEEPADMPTYDLRPPKFIGRWRRLA